jgi:ribonuclease Z
MKSSKKILIGLVLALLALATALYAFRIPLGLAVAQRVATRHMALDPMADLPDGLHVGLCGAGSPFPDDQRSGPCTLVVAGKRLFVFDAGGGAARNIGRMGFSHGHIEAVFLTHFHSDHIDGLGELMLQRWVSTSNTNPLPINGPEGVEVLVKGLMQSYSMDQQYRVAHHGEATVHAGGFGGIAKPFQLGADGSVVVLKEGDLEIVAFGVDHSPVHPAVGYRIQYKDRTVVLSGDTVKSAAVQRQSKGVDLLVHEALSPRLVAMLSESAVQAGRLNLKKIFADILNYHATPEQAAETARDAQVGYLLFNHIVPMLPPLPGLEAAFLGDAPSIYKGPIRVGIDGDFISLPTGSHDLRHSRRF